MLPPASSAGPSTGAPAPDRLPPGFLRLIAAQFCSALADNALLIVAIAQLQQAQMAAWLAPMLKFGFTLAYVLLAPVVGPLADAFAKARVMAAMNAVKLAGAALLLAGVHPVAAFALVGLGAAAYAPAKYGLITEWVPPRQLVAANGWIEVSVVGAVLLGTGLGGALVSATWLGSAAVAALQAAGGLAQPLGVSLGLVLAVYALASLLNIGLPASGARYAQRSRHPRALLRDFADAQRLLWRDPLGGLSLAATTLFWGAGAVLQFIVLRWAHEALGLPLSQAALLQAAVAVGVVAGAAAAGRWVPLAAAPRMLVCGVALGLALPLLAPVRQLALALPLLLAAGALGGLMVVPLNALLQHRGCALLTAGRSIAVQGFNENASILLMLGLYTLALRGGVALPLLMTLFGLGLAAAVTRLAWRARAMAQPPAAAPAPAAAPIRSGR